MKLSTTQLNQYFGRAYSTAELAEAIEKTGIELEAVIYAEPLNTKIIVGLTKKVVQHPNADKLRLVLVDVGGPAMLHIVCGAPNVDEDQKVAVATVGAVLPDGTQIHEAKLRGELSQGMLCSEAELGMSSNHDGILILPEDYQVGKSLCDIVESDSIVDIKSAANRSDLQSYEGVAREIAAQLGVVAKLPKAGEVSAAANTKLVKKLPKGVPAYSATVMEFASTPQSLSAAQLSVLKASNVRSINPLVDVTNYILLTTGQPLHVFDADKVTLPLEVRYAVKGESLNMLDGKTRQLTIDDLVIADAKGPVALAGVMGGTGTEVSTGTRRVILEAATFAPSQIRKAAQRHGIRTDSSARYERGLPVELLDRGRSLAVNMLKDMGGKLVSGARLGAVESGSAIVEVKPQRITSLLGIDIEPKQIISYLKALEFEVNGLAKLKVKVPWWRPDVSSSADIAEEVIKMVGYDALPATIPAWDPQTIKFDSSRAAVAKIRELLRSTGLFEVTSYSFVSHEDLERCGLSPAKHLKLKNPMSVEQAYMRSSLLPSLVNVLINNQRYTKEFGVSEISRVFVPSKKKGDLPNEPTRLAVARFGDYFSVKQTLDLLARELRLDLRFVPTKTSHFYPGRQADVLLSGEVIGSIGELHPSLLSGIKGERAVTFAELNLEPLVKAADSQVFTAISRFPSISRDVAVLVKNSVLWSEISAAINDAMPNVKLSFVSRYEGKGVPAGQVSMALRLTMSDMERTLTDAEADTVVATILELLKKSFAATPRS